MDSTWKGGKGCERMGKVEEVSGNKAVFIAIEGIDGAGKSTQVERLYQRFLAAGRPCVKTREPGGTPIGDAIRELLLSPDREMEPLTEMYLYAASRAEHVRRIIAPTLAQGVSVICDRFVDASVAYQGYGLQERGMNPELVKKVNEPAVADYLPDLTMIIDVEVAVALQRISERDRATQVRADRIERRGSAFFARVRSGLCALFEQDPKRYVWLDGTECAEELTEQMWRAILRL